MAWKSRNNKIFYIMWFCLGLPFILPRPSESCEPKKCEEPRENGCIICVNHENVNSCSLKCKKASDEAIETILRCVQKNNSCEITELSLEGRNSVKSLEKFCEVVPGVKKLQLINVDGAKIGTGVKELNLSNLNYLFIRGSLLDRINGDLFENMRNLKILDLLDGNISFVDDDAFRLLNNSLMSLSLEGNALKGIPEAVNNLANVRTMSLKSNKIFELRSQVTLPNLKQLILSHNNIWKIHSVGNFEKLETLNLEFNKIVYVDKRMLFNTGQLKTLYINNNEIHTLSPTFCTKTLNKLYSQNNLITNIKSTFSARCSNVQFLDISNNSLGELRTSALPCGSLKTLKSSHNSICNIQEGLFSKCYNLTILELQKNNISYIPRESFPEKLQFTNLTITGNPFECTCSLDWIKQYLIQINQLNDTGNCTNYNNMQFSQVEFCQRNTTLNDISTEEMQLSTTIGNLVTTDTLVVTSGGTTQWDPSSSTHVTTESDPSSSTHVTTKSGPSSSTHVTTKSDPSSSTHVTTKSDPSSSTHVTTKSDPSSSTHVTTKSDPSSSPHVTTKSGPSSSTHRTTKSDPSSSPHVTTESDPSSSTHVTTKSDPSSSTQKPVNLNLSIESLSDRELLVKWNPKYFTETRGINSIIQINYCDCFENHKITKVVSSKSGSTTISNLQEHTNYNVCVLTNENICKEGKTNIKPENETLIAKKHKPYVIIISIVVIVVSMGLGYLLRKIIERYINAVQLQSDDLEFPQTTTGLGLSDSFRYSVSTNSYLSVPENLPPGRRPSSFCDVSSTASNDCTQPRVEYLPVCDTKQRHSRDNGHPEDWNTTSRNNTTISTSNTGTSRRKDSTVGVQNFGFIDDIVTKL
ncbi:leucine-rich repeat and fibronectin type-III domain-containing protein 5-like isoform X2 [Limulus polyphemus]|uniref:Leucine-rich repeat and fibronectin type-III domain-containing protein 5-like isoform X2 n=1 Tax=Limulus polyphemus TaxID=6850 RepID=A0ABM1TL62_LIMPO|nr:leucine-rich repeat and fibronectin type-III domain-containing protein 5-like isoform X2 [Limulus polyphemus]